MSRAQRSSAITISYSLAMAALLAVWFTSFARPMHVAFTHHGQHCRAWIASGRAGVDNEPEIAIESARRELDLRAMRTLAASGMDLMVPPPSKVPARWSHSSALALPALMILLAILQFLPRPTRLIVRRIRAASNRCSTCAYDLTGNRSGKCPECGTAVGRRGD